MKYPRGCTVLHVAVYFTSDTSDLMHSHHVYEHANMHLDFHLYHDHLLFWVQWYLHVKQPVADFGVVHILRNQTEGYLVYLVPDNR